MKDKIGILLGFLVINLVILTLAVYTINIGSIEFAQLGSFAIVIILILIALYVIWDRAKNIRRGLPAKDERLINISHKAGYYGFITAMFSPFYSVIFDMLFGREPEGHEVVAIIVIVSGFVFMVSYLYLVRKGN